jgi:hypothetical protein
MGYQLNIFTGQMDISGGGGGGAATWKTSVTDETSLPSSGNSEADVRVTQDTDYMWIYDATTSRWINTGIKSAAVGSTPNANGYSLTYTNTGSNRRELQLVLQPANATNPGIISNAAQAIPGSKTFPAQIQADGGIDTTGATTLAIGTTNATIINLGNASATINFNGTVNNNNVTNLNVADQLITINDGGGAGSGSGAGFEIEENAIATGHFKTSGDRNSFLLKAPNTAGQATITPGAGGITLDQSSHNPVTVTDTNSINLTLSTQDISADVNISGTTLAIDGSGVKVATGGITNNEVSSTAAIVYSKLSLTDAISNADVSSVAAIAYSKLNLSNGIVNTDVNTSAAIAYSKLNLATSIVNADVSTTAAIAYSKLALTDSITNSDVSSTASIAYSKLNLANSIINADINASAAIDASKIANGSVSSVEFQYLDGVTSAIQTQINGKVTIQTGDIVVTSFTAADNQVAAADVTGFAFANGTVRSFDAQVSIVRASTYQVLQLVGIQKGASWEMSQSTTGDDCGLTFTITNAGQIQYVSTSTGSTATTKFRAATTGV